MNQKSRSAREEVGAAALYVGPHPQGGGVVRAMCASEPGRRWVIGTVSACREEGGRTEFLFLKVSGDIREEVDVTGPSFSLMNSGRKIIRRRRTARKGGGDSSNGITLLRPQVRLT